MWSTPPFPPAPATLYFYFLVPFSYGSRETCSDYFYLYSFSEIFRTLFFSGSFTVQIPEISFPVGHFTSCDFHFFPRTGVSERERERMSESSSQLDTKIKEIDVGINVGDFLFFLEERSRKEVGHKQKEKELTSWTLEKP